MTLKVDNYRVTVRFARLYPDPAVFEDPEHIARKYLTTAGLPNKEASLIHQAAKDVEPVDDRGKPAVASGTAKYRYAGKTIMAEYMTNASLQLEYSDFGTGLSAVQHSNMWKKQKWGEMGFELRNFQHSTQTLNIPDINELYHILKEKVTPTALSTIELPGLSDNMFDIVASYLRSRLEDNSGRDSLELELYLARNLSNREKAGLDKRLTRESTKNTIYVILSKPLSPQRTSQ